MVDSYHCYHSLDINIIKFFKDLIFKKGQGWSGSGNSLPQALPWISIRSFKVELVTVITVTIPLITLLSNSSKTLFTKKGQGRSGGGNSLLQILPWLLPELSHISKISIKCINILRLKQWQSSLLLFPCYSQQIL